MLWFLLYPIRRTARPPVLSSTHPIRRAFYRHGRFTAQHWLFAMLLSVAIAMGFSYPTVVLSGNPTAGLVASPQHFWSTVKRFDGDLGRVDAEMRQVWVHGDYMKALDKITLSRALLIQEALLHGEFGSKTSKKAGQKLHTGPLSWAYHSPLMYWNDSAEAIRSDADILQTIQKQVRSPSSLDIALRPASVFAGKKFEGRRLEAADALVITLMNRLNTSIGHDWTSRMQGLASGACRDCILFPSSGNVERNRTYEFSFAPLSLQENLALTAAYTCMAVYVFLSLRRLKAFHSRFGLVITAITQITCSILASITVCGVLKINLATIPQNVYPFVVFAVGVENMFRLINAIVAQPATMATDLRIGNALGEVGPVSVATAIQNVLILSILSRFVSPGVAAFCAFACIATLFDVFYLLTFFVAVLNVDIRRLELQDALTRSNQIRMKRGPSPAKPSWFEALVQGRLPVSTRMAGTAVTTTFILSLNYHFFEKHDTSSALRHIFGTSRESGPSLVELDSLVPPPMNATLTPGEWMRMQDFETAREVMRLAKPGADRFVIRIFAPLTIVLGGANRTEPPAETYEWLGALQHAALHHFYPLVIAVVFIVTFVAVLMSILLHGETLDDELMKEEEQEDIVVQVVQLPHRLDIVKLFGNQAGHFVTLALDRTICVTLYDGIHDTYRTLAVPSAIFTSVSWPIQVAAIDDSGEFMACQTSDGEIHIYDTTKRDFVQSVELADVSRPLLFEFVRLEVGKESELCFVTCGSRGHLSTTVIRSGERYDRALSGASFVELRIVHFPQTGRRLLAVDNEATISAYAWSQETWELGSCRSLRPVGEDVLCLEATDMTVVPNVESDLLVISVPGLVSFLDGPSLTMISAFETHDRTSGCIMVFSPPVICSRCGSVAFYNLGYVAQSTDKDAYQLSVLTAGDRDNVPMCLRDSKAECRGLSVALRTTYSLRSGDAWGATHAGSLLGMRNRPSSANHGTSHGTADARRGRSHDSRGTTRHRGKSNLSISHGGDTKWEAFRLGLDGRVITSYTRQTITTESSDPTLSDPLFVIRPGPVAKLQFHTLAVSLGNAVYLLRDTNSRATKRLEPTPSLSRSSSTTKHRLNQRKLL